MHYLPRIHSGTSVPLLCQCQGFSQLPRRQQVCMYAHMYEITFYTGAQVRVKDLLRYSAVDALGNIRTLHYWSCTWAF